MALYHNVKGSVGYEVVGSPTIVDGVASGFSANDYLRISQSVDTSQVTEIVMKFNLPASALNKNKYNLLLTSGDFRMYLYSYQNYFGAAGVDIPGVGSLNSSYQFQAESDYWMKYRRDNNSHTLFYSQDGKSWTEAQTKTGTITSGSEKPVNIGIRTDILLYFEGSIDLNETYIKVNGQPWFGLCPVEVQRHQLKGPVDYSVVGTPTIADGVVSGFSNTSRLKIADSLTFGTAPFEIGIKVTVGSSTALQYVYSLQAGETANTRYCLGLSIRNGNLVTNGTLNGTSWVGEDWQDKPIISVAANRTYWFRWVATSTLWELYYSLDGVNFTLGNSYNLPNPPNFTATNCVFGNFLNANGVYASPFLGSIDLNETYIKVNGKLWFYQPADTKYIVKDGKLVWADPRIYLQSSGTQYIDTNIVRDLNKSFTFSGYFNFSDIQTRQVMGAQGNAYFGVISGHYQVGQPVNGYVEGTTAVENSFVPFNVTIDCKNNTIIYNIDTYSGSIIQPISDIPQNAHFCLFSLNDCILPCSYKLKSTKMYENGTLIRDFAPVPAGLQIGNFTVPSNGMFDIVNQQFYANQGTGEFTIGRDE